MRESFVELGVIIKSVRYGDYDARLAIFTAGGIKWFNLKGVYRPKAKLASSCGLFTVAEFTGSGSAITGINVLTAPYGLTKDLNRYYLACGIADALLHLEFVEQAPAALVAAVNAISDLATTDKSCYPIFIEFFGTLLHLLGYELDLHYDSAKLTHSQGKTLVRQIVQAFIANVDYQIQFCDMMYLNA